MAGHGALPAPETPSPKLCIPHRGFDDTAFVTLCERDPEIPSERNCVGTGGSRAGPRLISAQPPAPRLPPAPAPPCLPPGVPAWQKSTLGGLDLDGCAASGEGDTDSGDTGEGRRQQRPTTWRSWADRGGGA